MPTTSPFRFRTGAPASPRCAAIFARIKAVLKYWFIYLRSKPPIIPNVGVADRSLGKPIVTTGEAGLSSSELPIGNQGVLAVTLRMASPHLGSATRRSAG